MAKSADAHEWYKRRRSLVNYAVTAALVSLSSGISVELTRETGQIAAIWLSNAILIVVVLKQRRSDWLILLAVGWLANLIANLFADGNLAEAVVLSIADLIEVAIVCTFQRVYDRQLSFQRQSTLLVFFLAALGPACLSSAAVVATFYGSTDASAWWEIFAGWYGADALGLIIVVPLLMLVTVEDLIELGHKSQRFRIFAVIALMGLTLAVIYSQSTHPFQFLLFPAALISVFLLGIPGALFGTISALAIGFYYTVMGSGPPMLDHGTLRAQLYIFQLFIATLSLTSIIVASLRTNAEFMVAAFLQGPDYQYLKDRKSRFVAVNQNVSQNAGHASPSELIGKTDYSITSFVRASMLFEVEQNAMDTDSRVVGVSESVMTDGTLRWFETNKSPIHNRSGRVIGLAGVTRDATSERARQQELKLVLEEMADGVALLDRDCRFIYCNEQYHKYFYLTRDVRIPGSALADILRVAADRNEQNIPKSEIHGWVQAVVEGLKGGRDEEIQLADGRFMMARNRQIDHLGYVSVVSDVTELKRKEARLETLADQLRSLAGTDALTGLANRRLLDDGFQKQLAYAERRASWISVLMIDVDNFKAYNDQYGHVAGDKCLCSIAAKIGAAAGRPTDITARYGGEEFCVVLPDADSDGAYNFAEKLRTEIASMELKHEGSAHGVVTVSIGISSRSPNIRARSCVDLISQADKALYVSKKTGRNRSFSWSDEPSELRAG